MTNKPPDPPAEDAQVRIEREEFERGHVPEGTPPVEPRPAATVVVARPSGAAFEVLLLERSHASRFAPGAFVFPGGVLDLDDTDPFWRSRIPAVDEGSACVGALRELFEETGVLPGERGREVRGLDDARAALLRDERPFSEIAREHEIDFSALPIAYFSRWITPRNLARRYDTRFFLLELIGHVGPIELTPEHESARWVRPDAALEDCASGTAPMLLPTRRTLERLAGFESLAGALEALGRASVEPWLAKLEVTESGVRPLMPGDAGYDDAY